MPGEIGTAFVRIRPNTSHFKGEAEAGIRNGLLGLSPLTKVGGLFGVALGAATVAGFTKSIVSGAADMQKQGEALVSEFGAGGSKVIQDFAHQTASSLGISARSADQVANRFGILFKNLGIGKDEAAAMTVNLEQLVGAISQIRNVDPSKFFQQIPLALQGNLRSLRQLGVSTDSATIKARALALGLIQQGQALTPTAKAQAIYSIATDHLSQLLTEAQSHSGDFANEMRKLRAEFDNLKDELGAKLLPAMAQLGAVAIKVLPAAFTALSGAVTGFIKVGKTLYSLLDKADPFGGAKTALEALVALFVAKKVLEFAKAVTGHLIPSIAEVGTAAKTSEAEFHAATTKMAADAAVASKSIVASLSAITGAGAVPYQSKFKGDVKEGFKVLNKGDAEKAAREAKSFEAVPYPGIAQFQSRETGRLQKAPTVRPAFSGGGQGFLLSKQMVQEESKVKGAFAGIAKAAKSSAEKVQAAWAPIGKKFSKGIEEGATESEVAVSGFKGFAIASAESIKLAFLSALPVLAIGIAIQLIIEHFGLIKKTFFAVVEGIKGSWEGLKEVLIGTARIIGGSVATYLTFPLRVFLQALSYVTGILDAVGIHIGGGVKAAIKDLNAISVGSVAEGIRMAKEGGAKIGAAFSGSFHDAFSKDSSGGGKKSKTQVATELTVAGLSADLSAVADAIKKGVKVNDDAVQNARSRLAGLGQQLAQAITQENMDVRDAVNQAKSNTLSFANTLSDSIGQLLQAPLDRSNAQIQAFTDKRSLEKLRQSIFLPGGKTLSSDPTKALAQLKHLAASSSTISRGAVQDYILQYQAAANQVKQDQVNATKQSTQVRLSNLAEELNSHKISAKQFHAGVLAVLRKDKIPYQAAGAYLGQAFIAGFHQQTKDLFAQALEVQRSAKLPQGKGQTGFNQQIVSPLKTLHNDQLKVATIQRNILTANRSLEHAIQAQAKRANAEAAKHTKLLNQQVILQGQLNALIARAQRERSGANKRHPGVANKTAADLAGSL